MTLDVDPTMTIDELKERISERIRCQRRRFRLICHGAPLDVSPYMFCKIQDPEVSRRFGITRDREIVTALRIRDDHPTPSQGRSESEGNNHGSSDSQGCD